jgi:poly(hydroxyalkanoate) granule-associated protein
MPKQAKVQSNGFRSAARRWYLATVGAFAMLEEETEQFVDRLAEKGHKAEEEGKGLVRERLETRREEAKKQAEHVEEQVDERIETVLNRMNLPSKSDVRDLNQQISQLSKKVDALREARMEAEVEGSAEVKVP